jgi:hypothetical protein
MDVSAEPKNFLYRLGAMYRKSDIGKPLRRKPTITRLTIVAAILCVGAPLAADAQAGKAF